MENKQEVKGLEQAVDKLTGNGWYRKEVDKLLQGVLIVGAVTGSVVAMYGYQSDQDLIKGLGYGILLGDGMVGGCILVEKYLRNYFSKVEARKAAAEK